MMSAPAVGIDLGTTYSCVAVCRNNTVEIIPNAEGNRITPSYVAFTKDERLVGEAAKNQEASNPTNTVFDAKRLIGRKYDDPVVQADIKLWPFEVVEEGGKPKIRVELKGQRKTFHPEEISSMVLGKMKATAEAYLNADVRRAVITVPAYFTDSQRQATKDAGAIAGLEVLRIINEPTAGALAYGLDKDNGSDGEERNVLIFDLGGGTFDVSVLTIEEGIFEVRATAGDTHLGGEDFDSLLVEHFAQEFERKHSANLRSDKKALRRLRTACERAKRTLSAASEANIEIDMLYGGKDLLSKITRSRFEDLCGDLFSATLPPVRQALKDACLAIGDIHDVVMVGGSTRIPRVQSLLREFFQGKELNMTVNPDEAVAYGAAVQAAALDGDTSDLVTDLVLVDVTPLSLGINTEGDITSVVINRNTVIPTKHTKQYYNSGHMQTEVEIVILEGERTMTADNNLLGKFRLTGFPPRPRGATTFDVTFEIDANGILHVTAVETSTGKKNNITIVRDKSRLSEADIQRLVREAERFKQEDKVRVAAVEARNELERYCYQTKNKVGRLTLNPQDRKMVLSECDATLRWLETTPRATAAEYENKRHELDLAISLIINL